MTYCEATNTVGVKPITHEFVHECCLVTPVCICLGENDPYYSDTIGMPELLGVYQGAKPNIYLYPSTNQKPRIHDYDGTSKCHVTHSLNDIISYRVTTKMCLQVFSPGISPPIEPSQTTPSPDVVDEIESGSNCDSNTTTDN